VHYHANQLGEEWSCYVKPNKELAMPEFALLSLDVKRGQCIMGFLLKDPWLWLSMAAKLQKSHCGRSQLRDCPK
jgi:hypothetical protein